MMKKTGSNANRSSESSKNNGNSISHIITDSSRCKRGDECNSSSESSCGQGLQRKRSKRQGDLHCRCLSSRNRFTRDWCKHSVFQHGGTENTCCHILKETGCLLKNQTCQHCPVKLSSCLCTRYLPCSYWNGSCHSKVFDQERDEMTGGYCHQRENLCLLSRNSHCGPCTSHGHEGSCQRHLIPAGYNCSSCCKEIPGSCACVNAKLKQDLLPMGAAGVSKGESCRENTTHKAASAAESQESWLTLNVARPPKPIITDFNVNDISLGLPVNLSSQAPQLNQDIDLNAPIEVNCKSCTDMCAPAIPSSCDPEMKMAELSEELVNEKGIHKGEAVGCKSHQDEGDIIVLDDSDEEDLQYDDRKINVINNEHRKHLGNISCPVENKVAESFDLCIKGESLAKASSSCKGVNVGRTGTELDEREAAAAVGNSDGLSECQKETNRLTEISGLAENKQIMVVDSCVAAVHTDRRGVSPRGFKSRKKRVVDKKALPLLDLEESDDDANAANATINTGVTAQEAVLSEMVEAKNRMWESGTLCDLCHQGPSLSLGEWYAWCCGLRLSSCCCSLDVKMRLISAMSSKKSNRPRKMDGIPWSGKVHKMCALWSSEVYEEGEGLQGLCDAVKRGKLLICAACREYGATLGCRVNICRRSFHYPCADELASKLGCRMWDGMQHPVACRGHRHVPQTCTNAKERPPNLRKWRLRGHVSRRSQILAFETMSKPKQSQALWNSALKAQPRGVSSSLQTELVNPSVEGKSVEKPNMIIEISTDSESEDKKRMQNSGAQCVTHGSSNSSGFKLKESNNTSLNKCQLNTPESGHCRSKDTSVPLYYMGNKLISEDISCGHEAVLIPCTNDVDSDPAPLVNYIIENRYLGRAKVILDSVLLDKAHAAPSCSGCDINAIDDPNIEPSVHVFLDNTQRESDTRLDWQGRSMLGRLPYDRFGRLQFGVETKDIMECNSRCPCGIDCLNKELQKGIRFPLEVFKTKERGWGVRTMDQICRGKFVVEYIGEVLTHNEAYVRGLQYDLSNFSCLFSADHPDVPTEDLLVIDGFRMSNVSRFINHSCDGNLGVFRVYTETTDLRFCRIGLYALRDIEIGEELTYDYGYATCKDTDKNDFSTDPTSIRCMCGAITCRQWLWTGTSR